MKYFYHFIMIFSGLFFYMTISIESAEATNEKKTEVMNVQNESKNNSKKNQKQKNIKNKDVNWPGTFVPSEKINADSSVSFPVDI